MLELNSENFSEIIENTEGLFVIDLYADWCVPCKMLMPMFEEAALELPEVHFARINVDENRALAEDFHVSSIPMIALVKDNIFLDFSVGLMDKEGLIAFIDKYK